MRRARKLFNCPHVLKGCFNAYVLFSLDYCALVWMSLRGLIWVCWSIVSSAERSWKSGFCCLGHRRKVSAVSLPGEVYHRADHPLHDYLHNFVAARNTRASTHEWVSFGGSALQTDQLTLSFLPAVVHLWNLLTSGMFSSDTLNSFKSAINLCILRA